MVRYLVLGVLAAGLVSASIAPALANHWGRPHPGFHGYFGPVVAPVMVAPPVVVAPTYYAPPPSVVVAPVVVPAPAPPAPAYSYGIMAGPRGFGFGYSSPGFGVYFGR